MARKETEEKEAEQTDPVESEPTKDKPVDDQLQEPSKEEQVETPVEEIFQPEKKVNEPVPYERFREVNEERKNLRDQLEELQIPSSPPSDLPDLPQLEPDSDLAVRAAAREEFNREYSRIKAAEFEQRNADDLKDPLLASLTANLLFEERQKGNPYPDPDRALQNAKKMLEERLKPQIKKAELEGFKKGEDLTQKKGELGPVGEQGPRPKINLENLPAEEYAKKLNLPHTK